MKKTIKIHLTVALASAVSVGVMLAPTAMAQEDVSPTSYISSEATNPTDAATEPSSAEDTAIPTEGASETTSPATDVAESDDAPDSDSKITAKAIIKDAQKPGTVTIEFKYNDLEPGSYEAEVTAYDANTKEEFGSVQKFSIDTDTPNGSGSADLKLSDDGVPRLALHLVIKDKDGAVVLDLGGKDSDDLMVGSDAKPGAPQIRTSAEMDTDVIQTGATVKDTIRYDGLTPGASYKLETRLMCQETAEETGDAITSEFTAEAASGTYVVENIPVTDPDCLKQVVFEKLYDDQDRLVVTHEDISDEAQTVGGDRDGKKKKKKDGEGIIDNDIDTPDQENTPTPSSLTPPAPVLKTPLGGSDGMGGGAAPGRAMIGSVPSGEVDGYGYTVFTR